MYFRFIIVLCLTYYTTTVKAIDTNEIRVLWNAIRDGKDYIIYEDLTNVYVDEEPNKLKAILENYGSNCNGEDGLNLENFTIAASEGYIHRWTKHVMYTEFIEIIPKERKRLYITLDDLKKYYEKRISESQLKNVIEEYGKLENKEYRLDIDNFRRALNIGLLSEPLCDESESLEAVYGVFIELVDTNDSVSCVIYNGVKQCDIPYITDNELIEYYIPQIRNIAEEYEEDRKISNIVNTNTFTRNISGIFFYNFRKAVTGGDLPIPLNNKKTSQANARKRLRSETWAQLQMENENLKAKILKLEAQLGFKSDEKRVKVAENNSVKTMGEPSTSGKR